MTFLAPTRSARRLFHACAQPCGANSGRPSRPSDHPSQDGYIILFAVFLLALLVIALALAAPDVAKSLQRDKDLETYNRGLQYRRAIQLYYRKFNAYPPNIDALVNTNNLRFLRKKYTDPITGKDDWKPILFGQNKVPTALGFFGQPLAGGATTIAGIGPSGGGAPGVGAPGASPSGGALPGGISDIFGGPSSGTSGVSGSSGSTGSPATGVSNSSTSGTDSSTDSSTGSSNATGQPGQSGQTGLGGQTFGGGGIIGFRPASPKKSILVYKKKQIYKQWEFTYDPLSDMQTMAGANSGGLGQPGANGQPGALGQPGATGQPGGLGSSGSFGSSGGFGSSSGFGSSGGTNQSNTSNSPGSGSTF